MATPTRKSTNPIASIQAIFQNNWEQAQPYQKNLYRLGAILIASGLLHLLPLLATGGNLSGPVSFRKPIVFGFSTGITLITTTWIMTIMPKRHTIGARLNGVIALGFFIEVFLIDIQTWRGVPSHFNFSTPFDTAVFSTMGFFINIVGVAILILAILTFTSLKAPRSLAWAIRLGMLLLLTSQAFGNLIVANGVPKTIDMQTGEYNYDPANPPNVKGLEGLMKLPHFFTMHGIQLFPALAILQTLTGWDERRRTQNVLIAAAGYIGLCTAVTLQVFQGLGPFDLNSGSALLHMGSLAVFVAACLTPLFKIRVSQPAPVKPTTP